MRVYEQFAEVFGVDLTTTFEIRRQCGYNPQCLLTDQRTAEKKRADALVAQFRDLYPDTFKAFYDRPLGETYDPAKYAMFPTGGTITGRLLREPIPYVLPRDEEIRLMRHREPTFAPVEVDFGRIERRVVAHYIKPITVDVSQFRDGMARASKSMEGFAARMALHARRLSEMNDKMILLALFGDINLNEPEPGFAYERRLAKLLKSRDRRQRKRGNRLFRKWYRTRKGMNLYRGYAGK